MYIEPVASPSIPETFDFLAELAAAEEAADAVPAPRPAPPKQEYTCLSCGSGKASHTMTLPGHGRHASTHYGVCFFCDGGVKERRLGLAKSA